MKKNKLDKNAALKIIIVIIVLIAALFFIALYPSDGGRHIKGVFKVANGDTPQFKLEIADTEQARSKGLMFRKSMPKLEGMYFVMPRFEEHSFWMKNTYISLDMIFLDRDHKIVGILENVPKLNEESRGVDKPSKYIIELNAGTASLYNIKVGDSFYVTSSKMK